MEFLDATETGPLPTRMDELVEGERLIVWAFRRWVVGWKTGDHRQWERVWSEFCFHMGAHAAREALVAFSGIVTVIRQNARRTVRHHQPCCPCVGADEVAMVSLIAAVQRGEAITARGVASWLVRAQASDAILSHAATLADRLSETGNLLPDRSVQPTPMFDGAPARMAATLH